MGVFENGRRGLKGRERSEGVEKRIKSFGMLRESV